MSHAIANVLSIAGSDSGGGAGIQGDLKTFSALGVYGATVVTALTAQNTHGVLAVHAPDATFVNAQLDAVFSDIRIDAVKIGMLANVDIVRAVADALRRYRPPFVVLDTVILSSSRHPLLAPDAVAALRDELIPLASLVTPNLPEAAALLGAPEATDEAAMLDHAQRLRALGAQAILMKGGHLGGAESPDWLVDTANTRRFSGARLTVPHTHGTGCTLASAIAALLAQGRALGDAIADAKAYLVDAMRESTRLDVGSGTGPLHHFYRWW